MLLQTNSYIVPKEKKAEHSRLIRRFRQTLLRLGCDHFEVYEQVGSNWSNEKTQSRYVQILRFLDRKHQLAVQAAERTDPTAQAVIADFCELINFPYQQQQGLFAVGFYTSVLPVQPKRGARGELISTVEHEVVDDPEAEKPYPGASDGPAVDETEDEADAEVSEHAPEHSPAHSGVHSEVADEFEDVDLEENGLEENPMIDAEKLSSPATVETPTEEPSGFEELDDEFALTPDEPVTSPAKTEMRLTPAMDEEPLEEPLFEEDGEESAPQMHMKMVFEPKHAEPENPEPEALAELEPEEELEPEFDLEPVAPVAAHKHEAEIEPEAELEPELEPEAELEPLEEVEEEAVEPAEELEPVAELEPHLEPHSELEPEELLEPEAALEPEAEFEADAELEPEAELKPEIEPEPVKAQRPAAPPPLPKPRHEHDFMSMADGELTEEDEERAHGFIEGELVDEMETEHLDAEELTGEEVQPVPKHKSKNAPTRW